MSSLDYSNLTRTNRSHSNPEICKGTCEGHRPGRGKPYVLAPHLCAATAGLGLTEADLDTFGPAARTVVEDMSRAAAATAARSAVGTLTAFVYGGHDSGRRVAERGFTAADWLRATRQAIAACDCESGSPPVSSHPNAVGLKQKRGFLRTGLETCRKPLFLRR